MVAIKSETTLSQFSQDLIAHKQLPSIDKSLTQKQLHSQDGQLPTFTVHKMNPEFIVNSTVVDSQDNSVRVGQFKQVFYYGSMGNNPGDVETQKAILELRKNGYEMLIKGVIDKKTGILQEVRMEFTKHVKDKDGKDQISTIEVPIKGPYSDEDIRVNVAKAIKEFKLDV